MNYLIFVPQLMSCIYVISAVTRQSSANFFSQNFWSGVLIMFIIFCKTVIEILKISLNLPWVVYKLKQGEELCGP